jgi:hypothetical protein
MEVHNLCKMNRRHRDIKPHPERKINGVGFYDNPELKRYKPRTTCLEQ